MCATLASVACKKTVQPADEEILNPVGFRAMSQATWVDPAPETKATTTPTFTSFGVWGIARKTGMEPYMLWESNDLIPVTKSGNTNTFVPSEPAYWFSGYTYNFLAIAPYEDIDVTITPAAGNTKDAISFSYDMSSKYSGTPATGNNPAIAPDYDFDLLAAAAQHTVQSSSTQGSHTLTFWHLLSQIKIRVLFKDKNGNDLSGTVTGLRLTNVDADADYSICYGQVVNNQDKPAVECTSGESSRKEITITGSPANDGYYCINVVPQDISKVKLFLNFTVNDAEYPDFEAILNFNGYETVYKPNECYKWTLTITNSLYINFETSLSEWDDNEGEGYEAGKVEF